MRSMSTRPAKTWCSALRPAGCGPRTTPASRGPRSTRACRRSPSSALQRWREAEDAENHAIPVVRQPGRRRAAFYVSIFKNGRILDIARYGGAGPGPAGSVMTVTFVLDGQEFTALNGGPHFTFNEAISLFVRCDSQQEVDGFWEKLLSQGGQPNRCGWLK